MSRALLAISIGPVQDFIVAARRTRDLWFGSYMLSEVSKAVAKEVDERGGSLIFPASETRVSLDPGSDLTVPNFVLAELPQGSDPRTIAEEGKTAARRRWLKFAEDAQGKFGVGNVRNEIWGEQLDHVVECYTAWTPLETSEHYPAARMRVMQLLAGRKICRDFVSAPRRQGVPKSSLDGARDSVLCEGIKGSATLPLAEGEQLDAVGVVKRLAGEAQPYPSVARVAADPWLRGVWQTAQQSPNVKQMLERLEASCAALPGVVSQTDYLPYQDFPYEGTSVYRSRHYSMAKEYGDAESALSELAQAVKALEQACGEPDPYLAVLVADGDQMGRIIRRLGSPDENQRFSRALSQFASDARDIIEASRGVCVYAGGDDVLSFVPVDNALDIARNLYDRFSVSLQQWSREAEPPTLSVGITVAHFMEPLEDLLSYGRAAGRAAKGSDRNGLAVRVQPRGGGGWTARRQWRDRNDVGALDFRLFRWAAWFSSGQLPNKVAYDLHELARQYDAWPTDTEAQRNNLKDALRVDGLRLLARKEVDPDQEVWRQIETSLQEVENTEYFLQLAEELLVLKQANMR